MKKILLLLVLSVSISYLGFGQNASLKIKKANVFRIDGKYAEKHPNKARTYSSGNTSLTFDKKIKSGQRQFEFFNIKDNCSYKLDYVFKDGVSYEVTNSKNGQVLINSETKEEYNDAIIEKTSYDFKKYKKEKIIRLHNEGTNSSNICRLVSDVPLYDVTVYVFKIDDIIGPSQMGYMNRFNNLMNGNFEVELTSGNHVLEYFVYSQNLIGPDIISKDVSTIEFSFEAGKTYQFAVNDKSIWWEVAIVERKE